MQRNTLTKLWQHRDRTVAMLKAASRVRRAGLRASLRGIDLLLRVAIANRGGGEVSKDSLRRKSIVSCPAIRH